MTEPKTLRERTEIAARNYAALEEYPNTVWQRKGFVNGALYGPPIEFAIEVLERINRASIDPLAKRQSQWAIEQLKEARK